MKLQLFKDNKGLTDSALFRRRAHGTEETCTDTRKSISWVLAQVIEESYGLTFFSDCFCPEGCGMSMEKV